VDTAVAKLFLIANFNPEVVVAADIVVPCALRYLLEGFEDE